MLLYELESQYKESLDNALYIIENGCTLKDFLDLGFNNATLLNPYEEDTDKKDIHNIYKNTESSKEMFGEYSYDFTEDMLDTRVVLSSMYEDGDGFTCTNIVCENDGDFKKFEELLEV